MRERIRASNSFLGIRGLSKGSINLWQYRLIKDNLQHHQIRHTVLRHTVSTKQARAKEGIVCSRFFRELRVFRKRDLKNCTGMRAISDES